MVLKLCLRDPAQWSRLTEFLAPFLEEAGKKEGQELPPDANLREVHLTYLTKGRLQEPLRSTPGIGYPISVYLEAPDSAKPDGILLQDD